MLTTRGFQHISLGKEGVPSATRFMSGADALWASEAPNNFVRIDSERPSPFMPPAAEAAGLHKQTRSQSD